MLARLSGDIDLPVRLEAGDFEGLDSKMRAVLAYAEKLTLSLSRMEEADLAPLTDARLADEEILDVVMITSYFNHMNRLVSALGVKLHPEQAEKLAELKAARGGLTADAAPPRAKISIRAPKRIFTQFPSVSRQFQWRTAPAVVSHPTRGSSRSSLEAHQAEAPQYPVFGEYELDPEAKIADMLLNGLAGGHPGDGMEGGPACDIERNGARP